MRRGSSIQGVGDLVQEIDAQINHSCCAMCPDPCLGGMLQRSRKRHLTGGVREASLQRELLS